MKIKTKKVITEKEYLHYVIDNTDFLSISHDFTHVDHDTVHSDIVLELHDQNNATCANTWVDSEGETVFEVDIEEDITEDTKLPKSLAIFEHSGNLYSEMHNNKNINDILNLDIKVKSSSTNTIHIVNEDGTHTLIWKNGEMVE